MLESLRNSIFIIDNNKIRIPEKKRYILRKLNFDYCDGVFRSRTLQLYIASLILTLVLNNK